MTDHFPLNGIIGVVANHRDELDLAQQKHLACVEIRADLLMDSGLSEQEVVSLIKQTKAAGLGCLYTLRHPTHGGKFDGTEQQRMELSRQAADAGADMIDLEWDTGAGRTVAQQQQLPLILSYHNFNAMLAADELSEVTRTMEGMNPQAIKIVPTAGTTADAAAMLQWVAATNDVDESNSPVIRRIGFAMGGCAAVSRILTTAFGGALTYAAFGEVVAPGQIDIDELTTLYRAGDLNRSTTVTAVTTAASVNSQDNAEARQELQLQVNHKVNELNAQWAAEGVNRVAIGFADETSLTLKPYGDVLQIAGYLEI